MYVHTFYLHVHMYIHIIHIALIDCRLRIYFLCINPLGNKTCIKVIFIEARTLVNKWRRQEMLYGRARHSKLCAGAESVRLS